MSAHRRPVLVGLAALVGFAAVVGVVVSAHANVEAAPLDAACGLKWDTMSTFAQWWAGGTAQVGPAPTVVPMVLAYPALMVWLADAPTSDDPGSLTPPLDAS